MVSFSSAANSLRPKRRPAELSALAAGGLSIEGRAGTRCSGRGREKFVRLAFRSFRVIIHRTLASGVSVRFLGGKRCAAVTDARGTLPPQYQYQRITSLRIEDEALVIASGHQLRAVVVVSNAPNGVGVLTEGSDTGALSHVPDLDLLVARSKRPDQNEERCNPVVRGRTRWRSASRWGAQRRREPRQSGPRASQSRRRARRRKY